LLCLSAAGSLFLSINAFRLHLPGFTPNAFTIVVFLAVVATILSAYLAISVWTKAPTWANATLLIWAALLSVSPNLLYPNLLPRLVLLGCVTMSTMAVRASRKHNLM
jgi:hypothetical protein